MTTKTTPEQAFDTAFGVENGVAFAIQSAPERLRSLANQVEALTASQNICGSGAGCLHKDALIEALTAERDAAMTLSAERLMDAERMAKWMIYKGNKLSRDHACERCGGSIVADGFTCAYHLAEDIDAARQAAKDAS